MRPSRRGLSKCLEAAHGFLYVLYNGYMPEIVKNESEKMERYSPAEIEPRWQARWDADASLYSAEGHDSVKPKYYCLEMLPYPSGALHMGHVGSYSIGDALARHMWVRGYTG